MSDTLAAREFMLDFLRKELVGPFPGHPSVQVNGEEVLRPQDPPRNRYAAGVLFPTRAETLRQDETDEGCAAAEEAGSPESDAVLESFVDTEGEVDQDRAEGGVQRTDSDSDADLTAANQYLPSAMGISALVEVPQQLNVRISVGIYVLEDAAVQLSGDQNGGNHIPRSWLRQKLDTTVALSSAELLGNGSVAVRVERSVLEEDGRPALALHVLSRPHPQRGGSNTRLITFTLINRKRSSNRAPNSADCYFQCGFSVCDPEGLNCFLSYPERQYDTTDPEELSLQLLYLHRRTYAVGHGCAAEWDEPYGDRTGMVRTEVLPTYEVKPILPTRIPGLQLQMRHLSSSEPNATSAPCSALADEYEKWIDGKEKEIATRTDLSPELVSAAQGHMVQCRDCLRRMREGVLLLDQDPGVQFAFRLMNEVMLMQQIHYRIASEDTRAWVSTGGSLELETPFQPPSYDDPTREWRPFQLAFILMNLSSIADPDSPERDVVDVIWFPTGGGKTEAYLGLSAFSMFLRRLRNPQDAGTTILMRYTLRLLTTQQFQRAASMVCAAEYLRRRNEDSLGPERFSIGLWVGSDVTPNSETDGVYVFNALQSQPGSTANKFILLSCPWCGAGMGPQRHNQSTRCKGYHRLANPARVRFVCDDPACEFSMGEGLPLSVIDDHIYAAPPTLLIGTVDKFAMLVFRPEARYLFGIDTPYSPPVLIVQDELHLISGPLGSMVGHYETVVDALSVNDYPDGSRVRAKIIGSTATISRAEDQVRALYGRSSFLFPPQALRAGDSFFAEEREDEVGRTYVGVFATALSSHVTAQVRSMSALLQAPKLFGTSDPHAIDPYWTLMGYFNSLRELGHARTLIRADIREYLNAMWDRLGLRLDAVRSQTVDSRRFINRDEELASRIQSSWIPAILQRLFEQYDGTASSDAVDVCFATNMIQVGLDIPRLSLMTIVGQPKTTSEYIQASSRIGRDLSRPGIVVTNYNPFKPRDRSHYEHFRSYHQALYQYVEPTSITPFAVPVRDRALHALVVILSRFWGGPELRARPDNPPPQPLVERIKRAIQERVQVADPGEWDETKAMIDWIIDKWSVTPPARYGGFGALSEEIPLLHVAGNQQHPLWEDWPFPTPTSMRNVDASASARLLLGGYQPMSET